MTRSRPEAEKILTIFSGIFFVLHDLSTVLEANLTRNDTLVWHCATFFSACGAWTFTTLLDSKVVGAAADFVHFYEEYNALVSMRIWKKTLFKPWIKSLQRWKTLEKIPNHYPFEHLSMFHPKTLFLSAKNTTVFICKKYNQLKNKVLIIFNGSGFRKQNNIFPNDLKIKVF